MIRMALITILLCGCFAVPDGFTQSVKERLRRAQAEEDQAARPLPVTVPSPASTPSPAPLRDAIAEQYRFSGYTVMDRDVQNEAAQLYYSYMAALRTGDVVDLLQYSSGRVRKLLLDVGALSPTAAVLNDFGMAEFESDGQVTNGMISPRTNNAWLYLQRQEGHTTIRGVVRLTKEDHAWKVDKIRWNK